MEEKKGKRMGHTYSYQAYNMLIRSALPLPLSNSTSDTTRTTGNSGTSGTHATLSAREMLHQVVVKMGKIPTPQSNMSTQNYSLGTIQYAINPIQIFLQIPMTAAILIENMDTIIVDQFPGVDDQIIGLYLTIIILPFLLRRNPVITLHGSAAVYPGSAQPTLPLEPSAAIFIGTKGAGKSTTAAVLAHRGWKMLCDDIVPVEAGPRVLSGISHAKLLPDAFQMLIGNPEEASHLYDGISKYQVETPFGSPAANLKSLFILQTGDVSSVKIRPLAGQEKISNILAHTIRIDGLDSSAEIFHRITTYFSSVKAYLVTRPTQSSSPGEIAEAVSGSDYLT